MVEIKFALKKHVYVARYELITSSGQSDSVFVRLDVLKGATLTYDGALKFGLFDSFRGNLFIS